MNTEIRSKDKKTFNFRLLSPSDAVSLGLFFHDLSPDTRAKYGPHPLTKEYALQLCREINQDNIKLYNYFFVWMYNN